MHGHNESNEIKSKMLYFVFFLTFIFLIVEIVGSIISNSLALFADAGHMLQDVVALGLASIALMVSSKPKNKKHTFGLKRAEVIAAFVNGISLIILSIFILFEALNRLNSSYEINTGIMFFIALIGLAINLLGLLLLSEQKDENLNVRGAFLHILGDTLGSIGAIIASILILFTSNVLFDVLVSFFITILIMISALSLLKQSLHILMEGAPENFNLPLIEEKIKALDKQIISIHDTHIWSTSLNSHNFSCHLVVENKVEPCKMLDQINEFLESNYQINHATIQIEHNDSILDCGSC